MTVSADAEPRGNPFRKGDRVVVRRGTYEGRAGEVIESWADGLTRVTLDDYSGGGRTQYVPFESEFLRYECVILALGDLAHDS